MTQEQIYGQIERQYDRIRQDNNRILLARREEVRKAVPGYRELENETAAAARERLNAMLSDKETGGENGGDALQDEKPKTDRLSKIREKKEQLLEENGFPKDYLSPVYTCPECEDTGYLKDEYGIRKIRCRCFSEKLSRMLAASSGLEKLLETENFDALSEDYYEGEDLTNFRRAKKLATDFIEGRGDLHNFLFYGNIGTGKSFLSCCIANELLDRGKEVLYFSSFSLFEKLSDLRFSDDAEKKQELAQFRKALYNSDLLILDDLGTERMNSFVFSEFFSLVNERILNDKATVISTNLTLQAISDTYTERIFSRITSNYALCKLTGADIRLEKVRRKAGVSR